MLVENRLVAVAGTHLVSPTYGVAAVGNVFTHPGHRRQGYASAATSAVVTELLDRGIQDVILNGSGGEAIGFQYLNERHGTVKRRHPFSSDAFVLLPDDLHCLWTLPPDDCDYPTRWMLIKSHFTRRCAPSRTGQRAATASTATAPADFPPTPGTPAITGWTSCLTRALLRRSNRLP